MRGNELNKDMINDRSWDEFRDSGLLTFINIILHVFGWAIICYTHNVTHEVIRVFPARIKFRGIDQDSMDSMYENISDYLKLNAYELADETKNK